VTPNQKRRPTWVTETSLEKTACYSSDACIFDTDPTFRPKA
jgi:hypothetical protein